MATTLANLQTSIAYRLGEDSSPSGVEKTRRTQFINEGYFNVMRRHYWWFSESTDTFATVASQESYGTADGVASDIRDNLILELRFDGLLHKQITQTDAFNIQASGYAYGAQNFFVFDNKIYPVPVWSSVGTVSIKYFKWPAKLSLDADEIIIPDEYADCLVSFGVGRVLQIDDERGSASDAFDEFEEIIKQMHKEQNDYNFALKNSIQQGILEELYI